MAQDDFAHAYFICSDDLHVRLDRFIGDMAVKPAKQPREVEKILSGLVRDMTHRLIIAPAQDPSVNPNLRRATEMSAKAIERAVAVALKPSLRSLDSRQFVKLAEHLDCTRRVVDYRGVQRSFITLPVGDEIADQVPVVHARAQEAYTREEAQMMINLLTRIIDIGIYWFSEEPIRILRPGPLVKTAYNGATVAIAGAARTVVKESFPRLNQPQAVNISAYLGSFVDRFELHPNMPEGWHIRTGVALH